MRWIDRFWRDDGRAKATPGRIAAALAEGVIRSTNVLRVRLAEQGFAQDDPKRFESEACVLECLLYEWFFRDLIVTFEFGKFAETNGKSFAQCLVRDHDRSGLSPAVLLDIQRLRRERFAEYRVATGISISLQRLGAVAWRRIADLDEPSDRMTMALAMRATAELQAVRGPGKRYLVVTPNRTVLHPPGEV